MVQGKTKGLTNKASSTRHTTKAAANTKKGQRYVPPKKPQLVKQEAVKRNLTAKINKSIETQMVSAASVGKLTIMKHANPEASSSKRNGKA